MSGFLHFSNTYILWHYTHSLRNFVRVFRNILWFLYHFFSIPTLIRTLLVPFHRLQEEYPEGFRPKEWAQVAFINMVSRIIGLVLRLIVISLGTVVILTFCVLGVVGFVIWLSLPVLALALLLFASSLFV